MKGDTFTLHLRAQAIAKGHPVSAQAYVEAQNRPQVRDVVASIKATISSQGTDDWQLATPSSRDLADFIRPLTILGRLIGLRTAIARVRQIAITSGSTAYWVGERQPRPISKQTLAGSILEPLSVAAMFVATQELISSSDPDVESILSRDAATAIVAAMDQTFIDPANAGSAGVKPASITNGTTPIHSSGSTLAAIDSDLSGLIEALSDAGSDLTYTAFVVRPRTALYLSLLRGSGGALAYPGMSVKGGTLAGLPCLVSSASPSDVGSPAEGGSITIVDASQILVVDSGAGSIEYSPNATVAMADNPASPATQVSMFQTNSVAMRLIRYVNWQMVRPNMARVLDALAY